MNSPQNENGKTNLTLELCQETGWYKHRFNAPFTQGCFIPLRPLIEAKVLC